MGTLLLALVLAPVAFGSPQGTSAYPIRLDDPSAVYVSAHGGSADDTAAIQAAVDQVQEAQGSGIVFLVSGRYRISDTIQVWPGIRLIGYGPTRPTFVVASNTPGFDRTEKNVVFFAGRRPREGGGWDLSHPTGDGIDLEFPGEANPGTFYSAMSNVDIEIGEGNPAAVGVRGRYAQHCFLSHMDFHLGSALAGIHDTGNVGQDLRFFGGTSAIITRTPSPGWQFTLLDAVFEGQSAAAIRTEATGLTLIRPTFRHVPTAVSVEPGHTEMLWMSDARMEDVTGPAIIVSRENSLRTQINVENVQCRNVPTFVAFRESGKRIAGKGATYVVKSLTHGSTFADVGAEPTLATHFEAHQLAALPDAAAMDVRALPDPRTWVNVATLGAVGDGEFDNTAVLRAAIAKYRTLYIPCGRYRVTDTIELKPDTVLIGLHPFTTQILIKDRTPAFGGVPQDPPGSSVGFRSPGLPFPGQPVPLIEAPRGGSNIITGIGLDTGGNNPAAVAAKWMAGTDSMVNDVKFLGGHGSGPWDKIYNANHSADPDPTRRWDSQYPSLWVTDGGGGTFLNIWTASTFAHAGMEVSNTKTEGRVYELSSEHHVRHEVQLRNASNWSFYALQAEEERGEGPFALPLDIEGCSNLLFANFVVYRVISMDQPFPYAMRVADSSAVRIRGVHCNSNSKASFDSLLFDATHGDEVRQRDFASLTVSGSAQAVRPATRVQKLAGGFFNISGGAVDEKGDFYFVDAHFHRICRWDAERGGVSTVTDAPLSPVNLAFDDAGNLIVVSYAGKGTVYSFEPGGERITLLKPQAASPQVGKSFALPVSDFDLNRDLVAGRTLHWDSLFPSPDGSTFLPVERSFLEGGMSWGVKAQAVIRSFGLTKAKPGQTVYMTGENDLQTYSATVEADGSLSHGKLFAEQGGEGLAVDAKGKVYIAAGQIYVYDPSGKQIRTIRVPERPIQLMFGGRDGKTLFIAARTSLYSVRP